MFSLIDAVLLRPLPYPGSAQLVALFETNLSRKTGTQGVAPVQVEEWNRMNRSFTGIGGVETENLTDTSGSLPEKLFCGLSSPRFFTVLGVPPLIGRQFTPEEERFGGPNVALLGERFWRRRFAGDPKVLGKALRLNGNIYPIAGVMPASFRLPVSNDEVDVWLPDALPDSVLRNREARFYLGVARLRKGVNLVSAKADLDSVQGQLASQYPPTDAHWTPIVRPLKDVTVGGSRQGLWILFGAVGVVLVIGCANIACLLLAQAHRRAREMAIRFSLGAKRRQVIQQLLMEAFLVALPGAVMGLLLSSWATDALRTIAAEQIPRGDEIQLSWPVAWFTLSLSVVATFLFGLIPALTATRGDMAPALMQGSRTQVGARQLPLRLLVSGQVALTMVLLVGAGLLLRTMANLSAVPLGFQTGNILKLRISASWAEQANYKGVQWRMERTLQAIESVPGVQSAAVALNPPGGSGSDYNLEFQIVGRNSSGVGEKLLANASVVSDSYFKTLGIPLLSGEMCRNNIDSNGPQEAIVNRQFVERFFPNDRAVGHTLLVGPGGRTNSTLIKGVVADARDTNRTEEPSPTAYWCALPGFFPDPVYLIRTEGRPLALANALRQKIKQIEPQRAVYDVAPLDDYVAASMGERRLQTALLSLFGLAGLLLASVGLYGVVGFYVSQRTRDIGLRIALGAHPRQVFREVFRQGTVMTIGGVAIGIVAGAVLTRLFASLLFGVGRFDPWTFVGAPLLLMAVAGIATWMPARRATLVDPMEALREE
jgi:putative ABC transport system permease protein